MEARRQLAAERAELVEQATELAERLERDQHAASVARFVALAARLPEAAEALGLPVTGGPVAAAPVAAAPVAAAPVAGAELDALVLSGGGGSSLGAAAVRVEVDATRETSRRLLRAEIEQRVDAVAAIDAQLGREAKRHGVAPNVIKWARCVLSRDRYLRAWALDSAGVAWGRAEVGRLVELALERVGDGFAGSLDDPWCARRLARAMIIRGAARVVELRHVAGSSSRRHVYGLKRLPQAFFQRVLTRASGEEWCRKTHSRDATRLHRAGLRRVRVPVDRAHPSEVGVSGQVVSRYWLDLVRVQKRARTRAQRRASRLAEPMRAGAVLSADPSLIEYQRREAVGWAAIAGRLPRARAIDRRQRERDLAAACAAVS